MRSTKFLDGMIQEYEQSYQNVMQAFFRYDHQQLTANQLILIQNEALDQARLKYLELVNEYRQLFMDRETQNHESLDDVLKSVKRYEVDREETR